MTTPAPATPTAAPPKPSDADMIEAMFRALGTIIHGVDRRAPRGDHADILAHLRHNGADEPDLAVIDAWLTARGE